MSRNVEHEYPIGRRIFYILLFGTATRPALLEVNSLAGWLTIIGQQLLNRFLYIATIGVALLLIGRGVAEYKRPIHPADVIPLCRGLFTNR